MKFLRKWRFSGAPVPPDPTPTERLRSDIAALEAEIAEANRTLADLEVRMRAAEARAIEAVHVGNDHEARAYLRDHQSHAEKAAALGADVKVLRAILDECYEFADKMSVDLSPRS
jgi:phage shock protein A